MTCGTALSEAPASTSEAPGAGPTESTSSQVPTEAPSSEPSDGGPPAAEPSVEDAPSATAPFEAPASPSFETPAPVAPPSPFAPSPPPAAEAPPAPPAWGPPSEAASPPAPPAWGAPQTPAAPAWGAPPAPTAPPSPAAPAWGAPPAPASPAYAPPVAPTPQVNSDPNGLGAAAGRLGNGPRKHARTALAVAGAVLNEGEAVEALVAGKFEGNPAVLVLTDRAVLLADDRTWRPVVERFDLDASLQVQGWQDDRTASLTLVTGGRQLVLDQILDRPLAVELAQRIRYRIGG